MPVTDLTQDTTSLSLSSILAGIIYSDTINFKYNYLVFIFVGVYIKTYCFPIYLNSTNFLTLLGLSQ